LNLLFNVMARLGDGVIEFPEQYIRYGTIPNNNWRIIITDEIGTIVSTANDPIQKKISLINRTVGYA